MEAVPARVEVVMARAEAEAATEVELMAWAVGEEQ